MKNLQESSDKTWDLNGDFQFQTVERKPASPKSVTLLLHGLDERGLRIYRKLIKYLPQDSYVIAPNAPFPLPRMKADRLDFGHTWYFYDKFTDTYLVNQGLALSLIKNLLTKANPLHLPVTVVGFSQGGYLAPLVGFDNNDVKKVIGIGCEFRSHFFKQTPDYELHAVHGTDDTIIPISHAQREIESLKIKGTIVHWHLAQGAKHEINAAVGSIIQKIMET